MNGAPEKGSVDSSPNVATTPVRVGWNRVARVRIRAHRSHAGVHPANALAIRRRESPDAVARATAVSRLPPTPAFRAVNLRSGRPSSLADYRGRVVLLN